ncbi:MAG: hypothetical protein ACHQQQ_09940 [Bacteroidota bacterium]
MITKRTDIATIVSFTLIIFLAIFAGCSGSHSASESDEDFFLPIDTSKGDRGVMGNIPPNIQIQAGVPEQVKSSDDFANPLSPEDVPIIENIPILALIDSITLINEQLAYFQTILEASTIDPTMYYHAQVKAWRITNPVLRDSLFYALMAVDSSIQSESGTDAEVLASQTNDLIEVRFGTSVFKGLTLKDAIEKSTDKFLYRKVVESGNYSKDIELRDSNFAIPTPLQPELLTTDQLEDKFLKLGTKTVRHFGMFDASLYGLNFKIGPYWGGTVKFGKDELGLPFWTAGTATILASYKEIKLGFQLPINGGRGGGENFPVFPIRNRVLDGARGISGEFDVGNFGGYFTSASLSTSDRDGLTRYDKFYYLSQELLLYYSFGFSLNNMNFMRVKIGAADAQFQQASLVPPIASGDIATSYNNVEANLYLKMDYIHESPNERFGGGLQLFDLSLMGTAWLDIVPHTLSVELKYVTIINRSVRDWELPNFVIVSPRLIVDF